MKKAIAIILCLMLILAVTLPAAAISAVEVKSIKLNTTVLTLKVGQAATLKVSLTPSNSSLKTLTYTSENEKIATVSDGIVNAVSKGNTTITVYTTNSKIFAKCKVNVSTVDPKDMPTLVMTYVGLQVPSDLKLIEAELNKITTAKISAKVKLMGFTYGTMLEKLTLMLAANTDQLDVVFAPFRNGIVSAASKGQLTPLNSLLKKYGKGITKAIDPSIMPGTQVNSETFIVTTNRNLAYQPGWFIPKTIADKLDINVNSIKSYEDLTPVFAKIKKAYPNLPVVASSGTKPTLVTGSNGSFTDQLGDYLGVLMDNKLKVTNLFETEYYRKICQLTQSWNKAGYIYPDIITDPSNNGQILIKNNRLISYFSVTKPGAEVENSGSTGQEVLCARLAEPIATTAVIQSWGYIIPANSIDPDKAMSLLNLLYEDADVVNLFCYGIKGVHYEVNSDGMAQYVNNKPNLGYSVHTQWQWGNPFLANVWKGDDKNLWKNLDSWNKGALKSKALGFNFDANKLVAENVALNAVISKYRSMLEWGFGDYNALLPKFNEELKAAGLDKYMAEKQAQLDAWAKKNNVK